MSYIETLLQSSSYLVAFPPQISSYLWSKEKVFDPVVVTTATR